MCNTFCGCVDDVFKNFLYTLNLKKNHLWILNSKISIGWGLLLIASCSSTKGNDSLIFLCNILKKMKFPPQWQKKWWNWFQVCVSKLFKDSNRSKITLLTLCTTVRLLHILHSSELFVLKNKRMFFQSCLSSIFIVICKIIIIVYIYNKMIDENTLVFKMNIVTCSIALYMNDYVREKIYSLKLWIIGEINFRWFCCDFFFVENSIVLAFCRIV